MNLIINEIKKGNRQVFKIFFNKNYEDLVIYANGYLFDKQASEDVVQDVFVYIWEKPEKINIESSLQGYIYRMVRNRCLNYLKSLKITDNFDLLDFNIALITEHVFDTTSDQDKQIVYHQVLKIVDSLPDKMQQIVRLKFLHGYKYKEIAAELDISINTVKTQLKRAKLKISESIMCVLVLLDLYL
ncbi:RNA polymerase sigma-70 factor [Winogradskyella sp. F6397]|uniref:RNA polymerase sigma-70 factor n=1 Tax=Winogradskyella marina TaxID=2785530 RepID=A0ABS0EEL4_9FLAO|nr:RNA polymerase sigma-70 factor [Winogradskyella marina]MBF8148897.1 RNA polymerase sigma-70 factor [Winogradskyella marina]